MVGMLDGISNFSYNIWMKSTIPIPLQIQKSFYQA